MVNRVKLMMCMALAALLCLGATAPLAGAQFQTGDPAVDAGDIPTPSPTATVAPTATPDNGGLAPDDGNGDDEPSDDGNDGNNGGLGGEGDKGDKGNPGGIAGTQNGDALPLRDSQGGSLPFTGLDLVLIVLLGLGLLAAGSALRLGDRFRAARRS